MHTHLLRRDPVAGVAGVAGVVLLLVAAGLAGVDANPGDSPSTIAAATLDSREGAEFASYAGLAAAFLLMVFVSRLYAVLRRPDGSGVRAAALALAGGTLVAAVLLMDVGFALVTSEYHAFGDATDPARLLVLWSWNSASLYAPGLAALVVGGMTRAFPTWFRWMSAVLAILMAVLVFGGIPGLGTAPAVLWVIVASTLLALGHTVSESRRGEAGDTDRRVLHHDHVDTEHGRRT